MSGIPCIGRMAGRNGDWYAQLDYEQGEAVIIERGAKGDIGPVCTVPLGAFYAADDEYDEDLVPNDDRNKNLVAIVFAPEAWRSLTMVKERIEKAYADAEMPPWAESIVDEINDQLECLKVPWFCRGCGGTAWGTVEGEDQVICDDCGGFADQPASAADGEDSEVRG